MVLEHLFSSKRIEQSPWLIAWMAFMFVAIAVSITAIWIYDPVHPDQSAKSGFFIITLVVMPAIPFFHHEIISQEKEQEKNCAAGPMSMFTCYNRLIRFYGYFFLGTALGFAFCSTIMPENVSNVMFSVQKNEILMVNPLVPLATLQATTFQGDFLGLFFHNLEVLFLMVVFSFVYSIGSIFLLVWNASIVGVFLEQYIRNSIPAYSSYGVLGFPTAFLVGSFKGLMRLLPHGIFEISAFFVASIAGGVLSIAIERKMFRKSNLHRVFLDVCVLLAFSVVLLLVAAWIESSYT